MRNVLKDKSHKMLDDTLFARLNTKSAVQSSSSNCCHDYNFDFGLHISNWSQSYSKFADSKNNSDQCEPVITRTEEISSDPVTKT